MVNYLTILSFLIMAVTIIAVAFFIPATNKIGTRFQELAGRWVSADGYIRQELFADGHYKEAKGNSTVERSGRFEICGNNIKYLNDSGNTVSGNFSKNMLYHEGHILYRETVQI